MIDRSSERTEQVPRLIHYQHEERTVLVLAQVLGHPMDHRVVPLSADTFLEFDMEDVLVAVMVQGAERPNPDRVPFPVEWR